MKSHFPMKGGTPRLTLKKRLKVIRNWPIECEVETEIVKTPGNVAHEMSLSKVCAKNF